MRKGLTRSPWRPRIEVTAIGPGAAERSAGLALEGPPIEAALIVGLCGLLVPEFAVGDVLAYGEVLPAAGAAPGTGADRAEEQRPTVVLDAVLSAELAAALPRAHARVRALQSGAIVAKADAKRELARKYGAQAVDMESYSLAERLQRAGVAVAVLRVGSDGSDDDLPDLSAAVDPSGSLDPVKTALAMLRRPAAGLRLARNGIRSLAALEAALEQVGNYVGEVPKP